MYSSGIVTVGAGGELAVAADPQLPTALVERPRQLVCHFGRSRRIQAAVTPHHLHLRALALGRERVADARAGRRGLLEERGRLGLDPRGVAEIEGPVGGVHDVARRSEGTRLNSSHDQISYAVFCLKKKKKNTKDV